MVSPSFLPTVQAARQLATKLVSIWLSLPDFELDFDILLDQLKGQCLLIIDNPNNPTGQVLLDHQRVESIVDNTDALFVVHEACYEFSKASSANRVQNHPNIAITRTRDKAFGLAGARIGYLVAGEAFLDTFSSFYMLLARPSVYAAMEALKNPDYMERNVGRVISERARIWMVGTKKGNKKDMIPDKIVTNLGK